MGIDWEELLGEDVPLQEAYDDLVMDAYYKEQGIDLQELEEESRRAWQRLEDRMVRRPSFCDGNCPFCDQMCDLCEYCGQCGANHESDECPGDCTGCRFNQREQAEQSAAPGEQ